VRRVLTTAALTALLGLAPVTAAALPALPPGVNVQDIISGPIAVPAGQTTTVDLGVPVNVSHHAGGWSVVSSGTSVSVTAPAEGGASTVVPVSAAGYSTSLTLVAEGAPAPAPAPVEDPVQAPTDVPAAEPTGAPAEPSTDGGDGADGAEEAAPTAPADRGTAEHIQLESVIEGNRITATLGMVQAVKLFNQFKDVSREGLSLRYLDAGGQPIEGVTREIDEVSRTLTLTYPAGQTPDNPFIMEVARDNTAVAVVTLADPRTPVAPGAEAVDMTAVTAAEDGTRTGTLVAAGVVGLVLVVGGGLLLGRRRRTRS
jgi:hypothetical protein